MKWIFIVVLSVLVICISCRRSAGLSQEPSQREEKEESEESSETTTCDEYGELASPTFNVWRDTIVMIGGKALGRGKIGKSGLYGYIYDGKPLVDDPNARLDSLSPTIYTLDLLGRGHMEFDITQASCIDKIRAFNRPISGFQRFDKVYKTNIGETLRPSYYFTIDYPTASVKQHSEITKWIIGMISEIEEVKYEGPLTMNGLGAFLSNSLFEELSKEPEAYYASYCSFFDCRARAYNGRYVSYLIYSNFENNHCGDGSSTYIFSYDLVNHKRITNENLFKADKTEQIKELLFEAMLHDGKFNNTGMTTTADVREKLSSWRGGEDLPLPEVWMSEEGVGFSFQPYQISCGADGSFHFIIPYNKISAYLQNEQIVR